jgi:putative ABC transport system permease protein
VRDGPKRLRARHAARAGDCLQSDLRARADEVEARLALGFSGREAVQPVVRAALRAAMIPTVNGMMMVGLVQLPGMMMSRPTPVVPKTPK